MLIPRQANPLTNKRPDMLDGSRGMLAAHQPLVVPMLLRLSHFVLNGYVVLVVSKQKGITLVFKTDPLQNVDVNSTFDSIAVIQKYIQREIEGQLREMFREDLPDIIHRLSQKWVAGKTKVEAAYLSKQSHRARAMSDIQELVVGLENRPVPAYASSLPGVRSSLRPSLSRMTSMSSMYGLYIPPAPRSAPSAVNNSTPAGPSTSIPESEFESSFPDIENYDPTYGLRPDDLPAKSGYSGFGRLFGLTRGLADLAEHPAENDIDWDESDSYDMVDWEETASLGPPPSVAFEESPEYETIPAVGGGTVTRPRIYHSQSNIRPHVNASTSVLERRDSNLASSITSLSYVPRGMSSGQLTPLSTQEIAFANRPALNRGQTISGSRPTTTTSSLMPKPPTGISIAEWRRNRMSIDEKYTPPVGTPSLTEKEISLPQGLPVFSDPPSERHIRQRSLSTSTYRSLEGMTHGSSSHFMDSEGHIVLRPSLNNTVSQLSTLSHSYHTLSPYARSLEHFTVRSVPHRTLSSIPSHSQPRKARRKRTYRLSKKPLDDVVDQVGLLRPSSSSPPPPSEFEASDVEHYFRVPQSNLRRRMSHNSP